MKIAAICCLVLILAGCASLTDIRQSNPVETFQSTQPPNKVANCIAYESQAAMDSWNRYWDPAKVTEKDGTYKILVTLSGGLFVPFTKPMAELTISPDQNGGSNIEFRTASVWGGRDQFLAMVKQCAAPQNSPGK
jgi:hypothetical protein